MAKTKKVTLNVFDGITLPPVEDDGWRLNGDKGQGNDSLIYHNKLNIEIVEDSYDNGAHWVTKIMVDGFNLAENRQAELFAEAIIRNHQKRHIESGGAWRAESRKKTTTGSRMTRTGTILKLVPPEPDPEPPMAA